MIFLLLFLKEVENRDFSIASTSSEVLVTRGRMDLLWLPLPMEFPTSCNWRGLFGISFNTITFVLEEVHLLFDTITVGIGVFHIGEGLSIP